LVVFEVINLQPRWTLIGIRTITASAIVATAGDFHQF